jgi:hypothetical protein
LRHYGIRDKEREVWGVKILGAFFARAKNQAFRSNFLAAPKRFPLQSFAHPRAISFDIQNIF